MSSQVRPSPPQKSSSQVVPDSSNMQHININMPSTTPPFIPRSHVKDMYNAMHGGEMVEKKLKGNKEGFKQGEVIQQDDLERWKLHLCEEIMKGHVESVRKILNSAKKGIEGLNTPIPEYKRTILNVAVAEEKLPFNLVKKLINLINTNELSEVDHEGRTALHEAIRAGNLKAADYLIHEKAELVKIRDFDGQLPIQLAAKKSQKKLTHHLHTATKKEIKYYLDAEPGVLLSALSADLYDFVLYILKGDPELEPETIMPVLKYLVNEPRAFLSRTPYNLLQSLVYYCISVNTTKIMESFKPKEITRDKETPLVQSENPDNSISENPDNSILENPDISISENPDISISENPDISISENPDISISENPDNSISENPDHSSPFRRRVTRVLLKIRHLPNKIWKKLVIHDIRRDKIRHHLAAEILKNVCWKMSYLWADDPSSLKPLFLLAAENGIHEIIETVLTAYPPAIFSRNENGHSVLDIAATYRRDKVFNIAFPKSPPETLNSIDNQGEVLLFRVAHQPLQSRLDPGYGIVFQMQRELRWYKELETVVPEQRKHRNKRGKTPMEVFNEKHQDLVEYENKWILQMANSCIIGGSLIVTIVFAAAITVPGGNKEDTGLPFFLSDFAYQLFAFTNAVSLILALTSVLIFISIFTSRYSINDYLYSLPSRMILGLVFLFLSVTSLMMDFTVILYIVSGESHRKNAFIIAALGCIPVGFFAYLQLPSLINMIKSTYGKHIFQAKTRHHDDDEDELLNSPA